MEKESLIIFSFVAIFAFVGLIFFEAMPDDAITGDASLRKKLKRAAQKVKAEAQRVEKRVDAEAGRFGNRVEAEWKRFDNRLEAELQRTGNKVEDEFKRTNDRIEAEIHRIDDNLKKFGKEIEEKIKKELDRLLSRVKNEVDAQRGVFKNIAKGNVCGAYNSAQKSDAYNINELIYNNLMPPLKTALRPPIQTIIQPVIPLVQSALAALNTIPIVGNAIYLAVAPSMLAYMEGPVVDDLTENAAKKAIRDALEECR